MRLIKEKKIIDEEAKIDNFSIMFSSLFYVGYIPKASGTFGSIVALLFFLIPGFSNTTFLFAIITAFFIVGVFTSNLMMKRYGEDPSVVVIDEAVGMWLTILIFKLFFNLEINLNILVISFIAFRMFDILKIEPSKFVEKKYNNGYGIMMDDIIAAVYAGLLIVILLYFFPNLYSL